jgi:DNA-binding transcriptional ArsR family regulator
MSRPGDKAVARPPAPELASIFFALGDKTRLRLVSLLCVGSALSIAELTADTALSRQAVTRHLQLLAEAGLVKDLRIGRERLWQFEPAAMEEARRSLEQIGRQWEQALGRLKRMLES